MKLRYKIIGFTCSALSKVLATPFRRISFAVALSVAIHFLIFWLPHIQWQHTQMLLPPLTVSLELLPPQPNKSVEVAKQVKQPELVLQENMSDKPLSDKSASNAAEALMKLEKSASTQQPLGHILLTFVVNKGENILQSTTVRHQIDIQKDRYTLQENRQTVDLSNLTGREKPLQVSKGKNGAQGLQPETYHVVNVVANKIMEKDAGFDWSAQLIHLGDGGNLSLPPDTQDALSFIYQLSQVASGKEFIPLTIFNGVTLEKIEIEVGRAEDIDTRMGKISALRLRKIHQAGEAYFEIWLGVEYRLLPVKFIRIDATGVVIEQMIIADMRVSDD